MEAGDRKGGLTVADGRRGGRLRVRGEGGYRDAHHEDGHRHETRGGPRRDHFLRFCALDAWPPPGGGTCAGGRRYGGVAPLASLSRCCALLSLSGSLNFGNGTDVRARASYSTTVNTTQPSEARRDLSNTEPRGPR
jgi:hypothetical protein